MPLRNTIRAFVDGMGITRYQFAKDVGISKTTAYALYDNPEQIPHVMVLGKLCDYYQVQPSMFVEWVAPKN